MKLIKLSMVFTAALVAACSGADGANGEDGNSGAPGKNGENAKPGDTESSVSLVTPQKGVLDREVEVSIGGSATKFEDGAKPDFGEGIDVLDVINSSPTLMTARLKIAPTAKIGPRTVKIGSLTAEGAFSVIPALDIASAKVAQGGLVQLDITNDDQKAFDPNAFSLDGKGLIDLGSSASGPTAATGFLLAAPLAPAGKLQLTASNMGPDGKPRTTFLSATDALEVTTRAATAFALDTSAEQTFADVTDTKLFELSTAASTSAIVDYRIQVGAGGTAVPVAFVFGTSGLADAQIGRALPSQNPFTGQFDPAPYDLHVAVPIVGDASAVDHYVVLANLSGQSGAKATITASRVNAQITAESAAAHGQSAPQVLGSVSTDARIVTGELTSASEVDVYKLPVSANGQFQLTSTSAADLEIILTKDPNVLEDPQDATPATAKVLGAFYPGGPMSAQQVISNPGVTAIFAVVRSDVQGKVATGKYTLGARKIP